jgi:hypothetical protein
MLALFWRIILLEIILTYGFFCQWKNELTPSSNLVLHIQKHRLVSESPSCYNLLFWFFCLLTKNSYKIFNYLSLIFVFVYAHSNLQGQEFFFVSGSTYIWKWHRCEIPANSTLGHTYSTFAMPLSLPGITSPLPNFCLVNSFFILYNIVEKAFFLTWMVTCSYVNIHISYLSHC